MAPRMLSRRPIFGGGSASPPVNPRNESRWAFETRSAERKTYHRFVKVPICIASSPRERSVMSTLRVKMRWKGSFRVLSNLCFLERLLEESSISSWPLSGLSSVEIAEYFAPERQKMMRLRKRPRWRPQSGRSRSMGWVWRCLVDAIQVIW